MSAAEAAAVVQDAIDYMLLMRESSGEDNGELKLARDLERVVTFIQSQEARRHRGDR
jgi:hypothetical protein